MDHSTTVFVFRPEGAYRLYFQVPASVDRGLLERNPRSWKGTLKYIEMQIAAHRAEREVEPPAA